jgi:hypothetical protein
MNVVVSAQYVFVYMYICICLCVYVMCVCVCVCECICSCMCLQYYFSSLWNDMVIHNGMYVCTHVTNILLSSWSHPVAKYVQYAKCSLLIFINQSGMCAYVCGICKYALMCMCKYSSQNQMHTRIEEVWPQANLWLLLKPPQFIINIISK